jgi:lysylphosphatidylglycerol synthetase-like protein (DUF2156 family)
MRILLIVALLVPSLASPSDFSPESFICGGVTDEAQHHECVEKAKFLAEGRSSTHAIKTTSLSLSWGWAISWWLVYYGFGVIIGGYVYRDSKRREWLFLGIRPVWWAVLVILDPALGTLAYWAIHYSKLAQTYSEATTQV